MQNKMTVEEAIKIAKLYQKVADTFYKLQENRGVKFTKGRLKFRADVKDAIDTLISHCQKQECVGVSEEEIWTMLAKELGCDTKKCNFEHCDLHELHWSECSSLVKAISSLGITKKPGVEEIADIIENNIEEYGGINECWLLRDSCLRIAQAIYDKFFK